MSARTCGPPVDHETMKAIHAAGFEVVPVMTDKEAEIEITRLFGPEPDRLGRIAYGTDGMVNADLLSFAA